MEKGGGIGGNDSGGNGERIGGYDRGGNGVDDRDNGVEA